MGQLVWYRLLVGFVGSVGREQRPQLRFPADRGVFPDSGLNGCCGPQFVVQNGFDGINPPLAGNGNTTPNVPVATNVQFDVRFDPISSYDTNAGAWPTIEVGTRGTSFNQFTFGTFTIPQTETNWVRVSIPINPSADWTEIPHVFIKHFSTTLNGWVILYVDNIIFTVADVPFVPPVLEIEKATPALRFFARTGGQWDRSQLVSVDTNQSWVGGSYPVSYSFTISDYSMDPALNQVHMFLLPLNHNQDGAINQFTDFSTASNNLWLQIVGGETNVTANISWKTNLIDSNPNNLALNITNSTAIGTWTLTFDSINTGTLTAPGAAPVPFNLPADAAATFANPLAVFFGAQPNFSGAFGQHVDFANFRTIGVAGVPIDSVFTNSLDLDPEVWSTAASASPLSMIVVKTNHAWWVHWNYPDFGTVLATTPDLNPDAVWKTPEFYNGNEPLPYDAIMGAQVWKLLPVSALPTVDGTPGGAPSDKAFFRLQNPGPAE